MTKFRAYAKFRVMKQRYTTPVSRTFLSKSLLVAGAVLMVMAVPLSISTSPRVYADAFDDQKAALQQQIDQYRSQANVLSGKIGNLNAKLKLIQTQKKQLEAQLRLTQAQYDHLTAQIKATQQRITNNQNALGNVITSLYIDGQVTPLEMLASSQSISSFIDKQAYQNSMKDTLRSTISQIQSLKKSLQKQQDAVKVTLTRQKAQKNDLAAKVSEQNQIIAKTKGQQAAYQKLVSNTQSQLKNVSKQQRDYYKSLEGGGTYGVHGDFSYSNWSGNQGCGGGYPYCAAQDSETDPWGLLNRECVSYVAWALDHRFHKYVGNFNGSGNAGQWPSSAVEYSGAEIVQDPRAGDAVILPATSDNFAPIGHAMIVESVSGSTIHVSQYNFYGTGEYSTMDIGTGGVVFLRFQDK